MPDGQLECGRLPSGFSLDSNGCVVALPPSDPHAAVKAEPGVGALASSLSPWQAQEEAQRTAARTVSAADAAAGGAPSFARRSVVSPGASGDLRERPQTAGGSAPVVGGIQAARAAAGEAKSSGGGAVAVSRPAASVPAAQRELQKHGSGLSSNGDAGTAPIKRPLQPPPAGGEATALPAKRAKRTVILSDSEDSQDGGAPPAPTPADLLRPCYATASQAHVRPAYGSRPETTAATAAPRAAAGEGAKADRPPAQPRPPGLPGPPRPTPLARFPSGAHGAGAAVQGGGRGQGRGAGSAAPRPSSGAAGVAQQPGAGVDPRVAPAVRKEPSGGGGGGAGGAARPRALTSMDLMDL
jgi:hypothetical protein